MRRTTGPGSIAARAAKPLLALAVMLTAFATAAPAMAAPTPVRTDTVVTSEAPMTGSWNAAVQAGSAGEARVAPDFTCDYLSRYPYQVVDFRCQIRAGAIRVFIVCTNGSRDYSGTLRAVGTYNFRLTCPGSRLQTINWESVG